MRDRKIPSNVLYFTAYRTITFFTYKNNDDKFVYLSDLLITLGASTSIEANVTLTGGVPASNLHLSR